MADNSLVIVKQQHRMSDKGTRKLGRSGPGSLVMDLEVFDQEENAWTKTHVDEDELSSDSTVPMTDSEDERHEVEEEESGGDGKGRKERGSGFGRIF